MGQRTAILTKRVYADGRTRVDLYHDQWGFAKVMPMYFLHEMVEYMYPATKFGKRVSFEVETGGMARQNSFGFKFLAPDNEDAYIFNGVYNGWNDEFNYDPKDYNTIDVWNLKDIKEVFDMTDNNNGGMIVELIERKDEKDYRPQIKEIRLGFVLGYEEGVPFSKIVSPRTYMKKTDPKHYYVPEEFIDSFELFLKAFDIEVVTKGGD